MMVTATETMESGAMMLQAVKTTSPSSFSMDHTLGADCFVPQEDRSWNEVEPLVVVSPKRKLDNSEQECAMLRQNLCFSLPLISKALEDATAESIRQCLNKPLLGSTHSQQPSPFSLSAMSQTDNAGSVGLGSNVGSDVRAGLPLRALASDLHYAVRHRQQQHLLPDHRRNLALASLNPLDRFSARDHKDWPSLHSLVGCENRNNDAPSVLAQFCDALEFLLFAERREQLLLFERYSQYKHDKVAVYRSETPSNGWSAQSCWITLEGIADAQPPVQVGDAVLLRPCQLAYMAQRRQNHFYTSAHLHHRAGNANGGVVEVQAQVMSVNRATRHAPFDRIQVTWPEDLQMQQLAGQYVLPPGLFMHPDHAHPCNVRIVPDARPLGRSLTAVDWLRNTLKASEDSASNHEKGHAIQELLFPTQAPVLPVLADDEVLLPTSDDKQDLNSKQISFVRAMLQRSMHPSTDHVRGPMILTGPAGTGKTRTMLASILRILELNNNASTKASNRIRILVCAPSHTAANVITRRLGKYLSPTQMFRLLDAGRPVNTIINAGSNDDSLSKFTRVSSDGTFCLPKAEELLNFEVVVCTCSDSGLLYLAGCTNEQLRKHRSAIFQTAAQQLRNCGVTMGDLPQITAPRFTHLFIDEAAQATEAETLIPVSVVADTAAGVQKVEVALVGDPRQLSPQVFCSKAADSGLGQSWIERLLRQPLTCTGGGLETLLGPDQNQIEELLRHALQSHNGLSVFLTLNYRGHPAFLSLPSAIFYSDLLQCGSSSNNSTVGSTFWLEKLRMLESLAPPVLLECDDGGDDVVFQELLAPRKQYGFPIHFRGVVGKDTTVNIHAGFTSGSWMNMEEAVEVVEIIKNLVFNPSQNGQNGNGFVSPQSIGVMAPFRGQVDLIRRLLRQSNLSAVDVGIVEDYQAVEWDVIVLSLTRSTLSLVPNDVAGRMGLFGQPKRSNVALTRAESLFIVVGNPDTMMEDLIWKQFLLFCHRNGLWYGAKNDASLSKHALVAKSVEGLVDLQAQQRQLQQSATLAQNRPDHNGVIVSSIERLLRSSSIV